MKELFDRVKGLQKKYKKSGDPVNAVDSAERILSDYGTEVDEVIGSMAG